MVAMRTADDLRLGRAALLSGNYATAATLFEQAHDAGADPILAAHRTFVRYLVVDQPVRDGARPMPGAWMRGAVRRNSLEIIEYAVARCPGFVDGRVMLAKIAADDGDAAKASRLADEVRALEPGNQLVKRLVPRPGESAGIIGRISGWFG